MRLKLFFGFLALIFLSPLPARGQDGFSDNQEKPIQILPQVVGGGDWESLIIVKNLGNKAGSATVEFFDSTGLPLEFVTDRGIGSSFETFLEPRGSGELKLLHQGPQKVGWARVRPMIEIGSSTLFYQYDGNRVVAMAGVQSSPTTHVFSVDLDPWNGIALVNSKNATSKITVRVFSSDSTELTELKREFDLAPGCHLAKFFFEEPFNFGQQKGLVVVSASVPVSALAMRFDGLTFGTLPIMPAPRWIDIRKPDPWAFLIGDKIGTIFFGKSRESFDRYKVAEKANAAYGIYQDFLDCEMPLNGLRSPQLPIDRDENGLPIVHFVQSQHPDSYYYYADVLVDTGKIRDEVFSKPEIREKYSTIVVFVDTWWFGEGGNITGWVYVGGYGVALVSTNILPFLREDLLSNTESPVGASIPEFGGQEWVDTSYQTWGEIADESFFILSHELTHALGVLSHTHLLDKTHSSLMGGYDTRGGCFRPNGTNQCILVGSDAFILANSFSLHPEWWSWIEPKPSGEVELVSKDYDPVSQKLRVVIRIKNSNTGISSVSLLRASQLWYFKELTHMDIGQDIVLETTISPDNIDDGMVIRVRDYQGLIVYPVFYFSFDPVD